MIWRKSVCSLCNLQSGNGKSALLSNAKLSTASARCGPGAIKQLLPQNGQTSHRDFTLLVLIYSLGFCIRLETVNSGFVLQLKVDALSQVGALITTQKKS